MPCLSTEMQHRKIWWLRMLIRGFAKSTDPILHVVFVRSETAHDYRQTLQICLLFEFDSHALSKKETVFIPQAIHCKTWQWENKHLSNHFDTVLSYACFMNGNASHTASRLKYLNGLKNTMDTFMVPINSRFVDAVMPCNRAIEMQCLVQLCFVFRSN